MGRLSHKREFNARSIPTGNKRHPNETVTGETWRLTWPLLTLKKRQNKNSCAIIVIMFSNYCFTSAHMLKSLYNLNSYQEGEGFHQFQSSRVGLFSDLSASRRRDSAFSSTSLSAMSSRSNGSGLRFPPLIRLEKTAPSRWSLQKTSSLFRIGISKAELRQ